MRTPALFVVITSLLTLTACADAGPTTPAAEVSPQFGAAANGGKNGVSHLRGANEVPAVTSDAGGTAVFRLSKDGTALHYRLIVRKIEGVTQAHIHIAPAGQNGGVVAFLFGFVDGGTGKVNGVLAVGTITAADLRGSLAGQTVADLAAMISAGNAYVNVHTVTNPPGEIRGQIQ